jgi:hypothetical protein
MTQLLVDLKCLSFEYEEKFMKELRDELVNSFKQRFHTVETNKYFTHSSLIDPSMIFSFKINN